MKNKIPNPDLLTDKQAAQIVKNMPQYLALLDFKKDIKKVNNKFFKLYVEAMREEYARRIKKSPQIRKYYNQTQKTK
tara:strand:- start:455 stop:685 length:231 start_codon:yes stop_codon:yes gene_type:complete